MPIKVFGSEQFQVPWSPPYGVEYVDITKTDAAGNSSTITKLLVIDRSSPEASSKQELVDYVEHESGVTRTVPKIK